MSIGGEKWEVDRRCGGRFVCWEAKVEALNPPGRTDKTGWIGI